MIKVHRSWPGMGKSAPHGLDRFLRVLKFQASPQGSWWKALTMTRLISNEGRA